jgi:hypothetical protein
MENPNVIQKKTTPIQTPRTTRRDNAKVLTSEDAGKSVPLTFIPVLREDEVVAQIGGIIEAMETAEVIMNPIHCSVTAWFVPYLAFERFSSMDNLNRAYMGEKEREADASPVDFVQYVAHGAHGSNEILRTLGVHANNGDNINSALIEAYNIIQNYRRAMRSSSITQRLLTDTSLAEAFWNHETMRHIVPDYDDARIDGEVPLTIAAQNINISGIGAYGPTAASTGFAYKEADGTESTYAYSKPATMEVDAGGIPQIAAELAQNGITLSLSNIDLAKKTSAMAQLREAYQGHSDDYIIDLLMSGISIPEERMNNPMLLAQSNTVLGFDQRWATDFGNLDESVSVGTSAYNMRIRLPRTGQGGVIMVLAEVTPEQLWERKKDHFVHLDGTTTKGQDAFPDWLTDELDPDKVEVVDNDYVDIDHGTPNGVFGYAPLNHKWDRNCARIGGKYFRPEVDAVTDEDRQKIWAVETQDPILSDDFYLCTEFHQKVFADTVADGFEFQLRQVGMITGNTVFGARLTEGDAEFDTILAKVDQTRVDPNA